MTILTTIHKSKWYPNSNVGAARLTLSERQDCGFDKAVHYYT